MGSGVSGCAQQLSRPRAPSPGEVLEAPLGPWSEVEAEAEATRLRALETSGAARDALLRLQRLYDLFDAARLTGDPLARDIVWDAIGPATEGRRGRPATRVALERLLELAWEIEASAPAGALDAGARRELAELIELVSIDLFLPTDRDELSIQTEGFRRLVSEGLPTLQDNARWRVYEHLAGVMRGVTAASPENRWVIAAHGLYVLDSGTASWGTEDAAEPRPPWPSADDLLKPMRDVLAALARHPAWGSVATSVTMESRALVRQFELTMPAPRRAEWIVPNVRPDVGIPDDASPTLVLQDGVVLLDPGSVRASQHVPGDGEIAGAVSALMARDGRGGLLVVAPPDLPSPQTSAGLRAALEARPTALHLAVRGPAPRPGARAEASQVKMLSLQVLDPEVFTPGTAALQESRLALRLDGAGLSVALDGATVHAQVSPGRETRAVAEQLSHAFPEIRTATLTLGPDLQPRQIVDLLAVLTGGPSPLLDAVGIRRSPWALGPPPVPDANTRRRAAAVARRARLRLDRPPQIEQAYPLRATDQERVATIGAAIARCLPTLERRPVSAVEVTLEFSEGHVVDLNLAAGARPMRACVEAITTTARLRGHREQVTITFRWPRAWFNRAESRL